MINFSGDFVPLKKRNLTEETCRKFNVRFEGDELRFPYYSGNRVVAYKARPNGAKEFKWTGKNEEKQLFGQQLFSNKGKRIVITEGEMDAMSVAQAIGNWPVVSVPNGAQGAKKALALQMDFLMGYEEIVLLFDNDEAGLQAAEECVGLFPSDKVFLGSLMGYKDASDALQAKDGEAIRQAIWNKKAYIPKSIIDGRDLYEVVRKPLHGSDAQYPYAGLNSVAGGLRLGELVTLTAGSGTGKSTVCGEIAQALIDQDYTVGYIALEESIQRTGLRLMTVKANKPLHLNNELDDASFDACFKASIGSGRLYLRDGFGSIDPDTILNDIRFLVKAKDVKWVVLDHLSILMSGNESADERKTIDIVMTKLRSFVEETGIGLILISHLRRNQGDKGHEDGASVSLGQLRGSHSIAQLSDIVLALERNMSAGEDVSSIKVLKNRFNGQTGPAGNLKYNKETGRLLDSEEEITAESFEDF